MNTNEPILLRTQAYSDDRGSLRPIKLPFNVNGWEQMNVVESGCGVVRGMHWQQSPWDQGKLITVLEGTIRDVVVNISDGVQHVFDMELGDVLWVPRNYAHGFCSLSDSLVSYLVDNKYEPISERGVNPFCSELAINWGVTTKECNSRDRAFPNWSNRFGDAAKGL